jgi:hypothetical protein
MAKHPKRPRDTNQLAHFITQIATGELDDIKTDDGKDPAAVALGRKGGLKGGKKRAENMTKAERVTAARDAARARWEKHKKLTEPAETSAAPRRQRIQKVRAKIPSPED